MKTIKNIVWRNWFGFFIGILVFGCKSQKPIEKTTDKNHYKFEYDSSLIRVTRIEASNDSLFLAIPLVRTTKPECDSICQAKINEILSGIDTKKTNGKNASGFYFDKYKNVLIAYTNLKGSTDSLVKSKQGKKEYYKIEKTTTIPVNILTREQQFNLWTGRLFWLGLLVVAAFKIRSKVIGLT